MAGQSGNPTEVEAVAERAEDRPRRKLSAREHQVVSLVGEGKSRKEVAFELNIAHATVRVLYARARKKLAG